MRVGVWWQGYLLMMAAPGLLISHIPLSCHGEYIMATLIHSEVKPLSQNNKLANKYRILKSSSNLVSLVGWNSFSKT